jgi:hypothetical protein
MGLTMAERKAVTKTIVARYKRADKVRPGSDQLCAIMGWHRDHARKELRAALRPRVVRSRAPQAAEVWHKVVNFRTRYGTGFFSRKAILCQLKAPYSLFALCCNALVS